MIGRIVPAILSGIIVANPVAGFVDVSTIHKHHAGRIGPRPHYDLISFHQFVQWSVALQVLLDYVDSYH